MGFAGFQNPWALALLPLAAVPWLLHLMRRRRFRRTPFPSLMLLADQRTMVWRRYRLEELLLLAVRTALVAILVVMLARPLVRGMLPGWLSTAERWAVVVLDDSASMAAGRDGRTAMDAAREKLAAMLEGMGSGARVAVVGGGRGTPVLAGFGGTAAAVRAVSNARPRRTGTDLAGALALADRMLARAKSPLIIVASDFQKCSFGRASAPLENNESGAGVLLVDAGSRPAPENLSWHGIRASALSGRLTVEGRWTGRGPARIGLLRGGRLVHQTEAATDSGGCFAFGMELPRGDSVCLAAAEDGLALDDTFYLGGAKPAGKLCLVVGEAGTPGQAMLAKALVSLGSAGYGWRRTAVPSPGDLKEADVILVAASRLNEPLINSIAGSSGPGKGVLLIPPEDGEPGQYNRMLASLGSSVNLSSLVESGEQPLRLASGPGSAALGWDPRMAEAVQVRKYWRAAAGVPPALTIGGRDPGLVLEEGPRCPVVLWLAGISPSMSDLSSRPAFPVMLHRSLEYAGEWLAQKQYTTGDTLRIVQGLADEVRLPGGVADDGVQDGRFYMWELSEPGWYDVMGPEAARQVAINLPAEESDLEAIDPQRLSSLLMGAEPGSAERGPPAQPAWKALLLLGMVLLAAEAGLRIWLTGQKNG